MARFLDLCVCGLGGALLTWLWWSSHVYIFFPWMEMSEDEWGFGWVAYLTILNSLLFMSLWSFIAVVFTDPGYILDGAFTNSPPCYTCGLKRAARAHHCSSCNKCILRMDHHCPWIANCIGWKNHGHFLRFILYTWLAAVVGEVAIALRLGQMLFCPETVDPGSYRYVAG